MHETVIDLFIKFVVLYIFNELIINKDYSHLLGIDLSIFILVIHFNIHEEYIFVYITIIPIIPVPNPSKKKGMLKVKTRTNAS